MKFIRKLLPSSLAAQLILLVLLALALAQVISLVVLGGAYRSAVSNINQAAQLRQLVSLVQLLEESSPEEYAAILAASRSSYVSFSISRQSKLPRIELDHREKRLVWGLVDRLGDYYVGRIRVVTRLSSEQSDSGSEAWRSARWGASGKLGCNDQSACYQSDNSRHHEVMQGMMMRKLTKERPKLTHLKISVQMENGLWLNLKAGSPAIPPLVAKQTVVFLFVSVVFVLLALAFMIRRITKPLRMLSQASNQLGTGQHVSALPEKGPEDLQETIRAFNQMNQRIQRFFADRTHMLAALSHDLRTPITSMRLRVEMMPESDDRNQLLRTLDEMQQMSEATLAFIRQSADKEQSCKVELNAMLGSLCDDLSELGYKVQFIEGIETIINCRPVSLKRAFRNLIENAVKYGDQAHVSFQSCSVKYATNLVISIQDHGSGIPVDKMEQVFEPFFRLESSRNLNTGGAGLGMAIARTIIRHHGGDIKLVNNAQGLRVEITLP